MVSRHKRKGRGPVVAALIVVILVLFVLLFVVLKKPVGTNTSTSGDYAPQPGPGSTVTVSGGGQGGDNQNQPPQVVNPTDALAQCLTQRGVVMYGQAGGQQCAVQKQKFGDSSRYINEFDCSSQWQTCAQIGITKTPTWMSQDGRRLEGVQELQTLAQFFGCQV